jgi:aldehyde dehydrogenase (NAD+)
VPGGVINIVTGARDALAKVLAEHNDVDALWYFGGAEGSAAVERESASNLKQTWVSNGLPRDWLRDDSAEFLRHATQVKNIWVPYGA